MADEQLSKRSQIVQDRLAEAGVDSLVRQMPDSTHTAADAAAALGCDVGAIASSLVFLADGEPLLVMTSGRHRVDVDVLAVQIGAGSVKMASPKLVTEATGQPIGGVAPVGHAAPLRTVIDESLSDYDVVWAAAGTPNTVVPLTFGQLVSVTNGAVTRISSV